ncbi:adenylate/guanylate cyclase domain-containing protein [Algoriphagus sp. D3-2-R+10]|uniref:adenylate/guanylate cyclase domain-containing protein n=1 Tax=Algoriphagus aurantiacus TaxID=3103948 RepID=UPI002B3BF137|nr:adenylate/guanylate cyclase domain-containing protein [Algoriphagus sp. D3-2-R+10]MEB2775125.1 adenylate/guanylate cyclase domain-containing protein [Algoriphagus sp. D3-2-R+10]
MKWQILYSVNDSATQNSKTAGSNSFATKIISLTTLSQIETLKATNEASLSGVSIPGFRKVLNNENNGTDLSLKLQFIKGESLKDHVSKPLSLSEKVKICVAITKKLVEVHRKEFVHLNLNPEHILIEDDTNEVFFISLGLATQIKRKIGIERRLVFFEADYDFIAPEQTGRISTDIGFYSDIYALGIIFYWIFTKHLPFESKEGASKIHAHIALTPKHPSEMAEIPQVLSEMIMKMIEKDVQYRYHSAQGVLYDLEMILYAIQKDLDIEGFLLGTQDLSGVLMFSDQLYARDKQIKQLRDAFAKVSNNGKNLVYVYGNSGVGKSALVERLYRPVVQAGGFFISGKFDQLRADVPYSAFSQALGKLTNQILLLNEVELNKWKSKLHSLLQPIGRVLFEVIPGLEKLLDNEPDIPTLTGAEAQLRFNYALTRFFQVFAELGKPVFIFIDDLQWSDVSSLDLMKTILVDSELNNILIVGAYRDNEITPGHLFLQFKMELEGQGIRPEEILLENLKEEDIRRLVINTLGKSDRPLDELASIVYKKSVGNALFANQFLKAIYKNEMLFFDSDEGSWKWKLDKLISYNVEGDIVNLFLETINELPPDTISILKLASCIGNKFFLQDLVSISEQENEKVAQDFNLALDLDLVIESLDGSFYFVHDRVQQAIYSLIDEKGKKENHLKIGRTLLKNTKEKGPREGIFEIVNQFNFGKELISDPAEIKTLCELNSIAGQRAQNSTAYVLAKQYFENALLLLTADSWEMDRDFTYDLYLKSAIAAYQCNNQEMFGKYTALLDTNAKSTLDKLKLADLKIQNANVENDQKRVIEIGLEILRSIDIDLKPHPSQLNVLFGFFRTNLRLAAFSEDKILHLPEIKDEKLLIAMSIMHHMALAAYLTEPNLLPLIMFELIRLTLKFGLGPKTPMAFVVFGYINIAFMGNMTKGLRMGQLGNSVFEIIQDEDEFVSFKQVYVMFISHWLKHLAESIPELEEALKKGLETGDFEFTSIIGQLIIYWNFYGGEPIPKILLRGELLSKQITPLNQIMQIKRIDLFRQSALSLVEGVKDFEVLSGEIFDEQKIDFPDEPAFSLYYHNLYSQKKVLSLIFNQNETAWKFCCMEKLHLIPVKGSITEMLFFYYENLCITPIFHSRSTSEQKSLLKICRKNIKLIGGLVKHSEVNFQHRHEFMKAEYEALKGNFDKAVKSFNYAIRYARIHKYIQDEALMWERGGIYFNSQQQPEAAQFYLSNAYKSYEKWGTKAKLVQMKETYAGFISAEEIGMNANILDLDTILKTIKLISGEMKLETILTGLMQLVSENAGADRAFLITIEKDSKLIKASIDNSTNEIQVLQNIPYDEFEEISHSVINYVLRSGETLVLEDATKTLPYSDEGYISENKIKSILCIPQKHSGVGFSLLYLENRLLSGAFTKERIEILQVMATQTAISLQNAMLLESTNQLNEKLIQEVEVRKEVEENLRLNEKRLEEYNANLESKVKERTLDLQIEKEKSDELLLNILPFDIARELKEKGAAESKKYESVTVLFTDFKGFSIIAEQMNAVELVSEIDFCFKEFDRIIQKHGIEKIKTIGDSYMAAGGIPVENKTHPLDVINAAFEIRDFIENHKEKNRLESKPIFELRIGIHTGNIVAGIVGLNKFAYDIWGDTVNLASRMESSSEAGKINISGATYELVKDHFSCTHRGKVLAKNKGEVDMYFVERLKVK